MDYENNNEEMEESYVPLNWDTLSSNPDVWETIKEELDDKLDAECLMKIITKAKEVGLKDDKIFLPVEKEQPEMEYASLFSNTTEEDL
jgi:hypothetical protein